MSYSVYVLWLVDFLVLFFLEKKLATGQKVQIQNNFVNEAPTGQPSQST